MAVARPAYDLAASACGIVHLGVGAFMRAHTAVYTDDALAAAGGDWRIAGVSLRSPGVRDQLAPQDCLYTLCVQDAGSTSRRLVGALASMHVAPEDPAAVIRLLAEPAVRIVTLTVTEKGYCLDPGSGDIDLAHKAIRHDLAQPDAPQSTIGLIVAGLQARRAAGAGPLSIVSCDNLPANGRRLEAAVIGFAAEREQALADWVAERVRFPETMVDRIVPATTEADIAEAETAIGLHDAALVKAEPFRQWVIEDRFATDRPAWEAGGALFVSNVAPYESAKLRLLNGAHSSLAYLGYLAGRRYVHEVVADNAFARFARHLMTQEISPVTPEPEGMEHTAYIDALLARFANPALGHRTWQIAMDGSQKLPQRLLRSVELELDRKGPIDALALAIAGWMRYALGRDDRGQPIEVSDPLADRFASIAARGQAAPATRVRDFLAIREVFGERLPQERRFTEALTRQYGRIAKGGAAAAVRVFLAGERDHG